MRHRYTSVIVALLILTGCVHSRGDRSHGSQLLLLNVVFLSGGMSPSATGLSFYSSGRVRYSPGAEGRARWSSLSSQESGQLQDLMQSGSFEELMTGIRLHGESLGCCDSAQLVIELESPTDNPDEIALQPALGLCGSWKPKGAVWLVRFVNEIASRHFKAVIVPAQPCNPKATPFVSG